MANSARLFQPLADPARHRPLDIALSRLLRFELVDRAGRWARLDDLAVDLGGDDYPPVSGLICSPARGEPLELPWEAIRAVDWQAGHLRLEALDAARHVDDEALAGAVLLKRHVLDAQVLDLHNRQAMRPNDLWLRLDGRRLLLAAADMSSWAILRRLTRGRLAPGRPSGASRWPSCCATRRTPPAAS